jgi:hypothetical protein
MWYAFHLAVWWSAAARNARRRPKKAKKAMEAQYQSNKNACCCCVVLEAAIHRPQFQSARPPLSTTPYHLVSFVSRPPSGSGRGPLLGACRKVHGFKYIRESNRGGVHQPGQHDVGGAWPSPGPGSRPRALSAWGWPEPAPAPPPPHRVIALCWRAAWRAPRGRSSSARGSRRAAPRGRPAPPRRPRRSTARPHSPC